MKNSEMLPYHILDSARVVRSYPVAENADGLCGLPGCGNNHPMQAFDICDGVIFVTYDAGYVITYDLQTGNRLSGFLMECGRYSHAHHCGNAMFGKVKYDSADRFPLLYSSGDLSTKACYVERILTDGSGIPVATQMVQLIHFDMGEKAGENGAQAVVDPAKNRIIYQQRKLKSIYDLQNSFVIGEYPLPEPSEGQLHPDGYRVVNLGVGDLLTEVYELPYYSPVYQGADFVGDLLFQSHGMAANGFGVQTGLMVFDFSAPDRSFRRYINMEQVVGAYEPQSVSLYSNKLYMSYADNGAHVYELEIELGIPTDADCGSMYSENAEDLCRRLKDAVTEELRKAGKDYLAIRADITERSGERFSAEIAVATPYTIQTVRRSGTVSD